MSLVYLPHEQGGQSIPENFHVLSFDSSVTVLQREFESVVEPSVGSFTGQIILHFLGLR